MNQQQKELLYLAAKNQYYNQTPIDLDFFTSDELSDAEFDLLETELKQLGSTVLGIVGMKSKGEITHLTRQKSLGKIQVKSNAVLPMEEVISWMQKLGVVDTLEMSCKYDGNACILVYENHVLKSAASRGDGEKGNDITKKLALITPQRISLPGVVEIKGEVVIPLSVFNKKYSDSKNPRNFVSGKLNPENNCQDIIRDLVFVAHELNTHDSNAEITDQISYLNTLGFNQQYPLFRKFINSPKEFIKAYYEFVTERKQSEFLLDGIVIKAKPKYRAQIGENNHHPKWATAIKFPAKEAVSKITSLSWEIGKTGELTPTAKIEPTDLEGATISSIGLHNLGYVIENKAYPGATIVFARKGDIVPQIIKVQLPSLDENLYDDDPILLYPKNIDHDTLSVDGVHLMSNDGEVIELRRFQKTLEILELKGIGPSTANEFFDAGIKSTADLIQARVFTVSDWVKRGFKQGRSLDKMIEALNSKDQFKLETLIHSLQLTDVGSSISKAIAEHIAFGRTDFSSLNKAAVASLIDVNSTERQELDKLLTTAKQCGIHVIYPTPLASTSIVFEMTGSWAEGSKKEFLDKVNNKAVHGSLTATTDYLVAEDVNGNSSKIQKAKKLGVKVVSYEDFLNTI